MAESPLNDGLSGVGVVGAEQMKKTIYEYQRMIKTVRFVDVPELVRICKLPGCLTRPSMPDWIALLLSFIGGVSLSIS